METKNLSTDSFALQNPYQPSQIPHAATMSFSAFFAAQKTASDEGAASYAGIALEMEVGTHAGKGLEFQRLPYRQMLYPSQKDKAAELFKDPYCEEIIIVGDTAETFGQTLETLRNPNRPCAENGNAAEFDLEKLLTLLQSIYSGRTTS